MSEKGSGDQGSRHTGPPPALVKAVQRLLQPLVRLLLGHGAQFPFLAELLKAIYVEVARRELGVVGRDSTQSRISLLTGIHRKDVRRLITHHPDRDEMPAEVSLGAQVAARWLTDADLRDETGAPLALPRLVSAGGEQSFEGLVRRVSKDIRSRSVLDEWLRLGVVTLGEDDRVRLKAEAFVPEKGFEEKAFFLGQNVHDHLATAVGNVIGTEPPRLERSVFYEGLSAESIAELAHLARQEGMRALVEVNRRASELLRQDQAKGGASQRMNFGLYFYQGPQVEPEATDET